MTLPVNKATTPFKTMDIKTALLSGASRKRKSTSQISKDEPKSKKPSVEKGDSENVEVLDDASEITVVFEKSEIDSTLGDCKENKDINAAKLECSQDNPKGNKSLNTSIEEKTNNLEKNTCNDSANEVELLSAESSCDELNKSSNVSLNTSELTAEDNEKGHNLKDETKPKDSNIKSDGKSQTNSKGKTKKKMTLEEAQKRAKKREDLQKEKLAKKQELESKKKERQLEKEQKLKEKQLKKEREEIERKERERIKQEKKEQEEKEKLKRQKEKEEKAKMKQIQLEQKLEEKKKREEMRLKKEEEEKRAKLEKEQKEKEKQERAKAAFAKFFLKAENNVSTAPPAQTSEKLAFLPFQVSDDMTLAPVVPPAAQERFNKRQFDHYLEIQDGTKLYLDVLKSGTYKDVRQRKKNKRFEVSEVIVIDQNVQAELGLHPKLLQFQENVRPPYWGTWRKKSRNIRPRNPFGQDEMFDYDVDSDDEWDEGGPGESLSGSENEVESEDEYEVDNEFFVPHGYLSDEEEKKEDDDEEVNDPEKRKALLKLKLQEFEMERKKKTTELKPIILGCYFANDSAFQDSGLQKFLEAYSAEFLTETTILTRFTVKSQQSKPNNNAAESPKSANNANLVKKPFPEKAFPHLIRLVHGSVKNRKILAEEFQKFWLEQSEEKSEVKQNTNEPLSNSETILCKESTDDVPSDFFQISLKQIRDTIKEIATYGKCPDVNFKKCCWWVYEKIREKYGLLDAPIPNQWKYVPKSESQLSTRNSSSIKGFLSSN